VLSLYCQGSQPIVVRDREKTRPLNQPASRDGPDRPAGAGPLSLTGQPNAMGGREVGGMATLLSVSPRSREPGASRGSRRAVGVSSVCPDRPGKTAVEMFESLARATSG
jgi:assimilatory nitrate reductase catalytic subunit